MGRFRSNRKACDFEIVLMRLFLNTRCTFALLLCFCLNSNLLYGIERIYLDNVDDACAFIREHEKKVKQRFLSDMDANQKRAARAFDEALCALDSTYVQENFRIDNIQRYLEAKPIVSTERYLQLVGTKERMTISLATSIRDTLKVLQQLLEVWFFGSEGEKLAGQESCQNHLRAIKSIIEYKAKPLWQISPAKFKGASS